MDKFNNLPEARQNAIINAALEAFGRNGYKKASVNDIAISAGISKAMVFHYFGRKKDLYLFLLRLYGDILIKEFEDRFDKNITDFFERVMLASDIKISAMKKHPAILIYFKSVYYETDPEVKPDIDRYLTESGNSFTSRVLYDGMDVSRFKDGIDPWLIMRMIIYFSEGCMNDAPKDAAIDLEGIVEEVKKCVYILKTNLYKDTGE